VSACVFYGGVGCCELLLLLLLAAPVRGSWRALRRSGGVGFSSRSIRSSWRAAAISPLIQRLQERSAVGVFVEGAVEQTVWLI
jgi:hypothetical protein